MSLHNIIDDLVRAIETDDIDRLNEIQLNDLSAEELNLAEDATYNDLLDVVIEAVEFRIENTPEPVKETYTLKELNAMKTVLYKTNGRYASQVLFDSKNKRVIKVTLAVDLEPFVVVNVIVIK